MNHPESSNNYHRNQVKEAREDSKEKKHDRKVYVHRNSVLTDMLEVNHIQTIHNMCHSAFIFLILCTIFYYIADPSKMWEDIEFVKWGLSTFPHCVMFWLLYHVFAFSFYEGFKLWIDVRSKIQSKVADKIFLLLFIASYSLTLTVTGYYMIRAEIGPILGFALGTEQGRIHMKIYSFVRECAPRVLQHKPDKDGSQKHALCPTRKHYCYFLFAPVFLYRDSYPRTEETKWKNVIYHGSQVLFCIILYFCILRRYRELFVTVGLRPFTLKDSVLAFAASIVPGLISLILLWYTVLHSWLNMFAEILRFGDREFYEDFWNATTAGQHHRKWNIVVHDWFHTYCHVDFKKFGCSDILSRTFVFMISSFFHDYMLCLTFGFFYPIFGIFYALGGIILVPMTRGKRGQQWNILLWFVNVLLIQTCAYHFAIEWYARKNCPKDETLVDFFYPRVLDPSCEITIMSDRFNFF